jgi:sterol desaturase/sphingolipid hydroxylase (fatty acid hydroxylase superfamily)
MHKVHHSREKGETNSNYSNILSIWDRLFCTYTAVTKWEALRYGLEHQRDETLGEMLGGPFRSR